MLPKYQKKPTLADVAAKRNQTLEQLLGEWAVTSIDELAKRCKREGVGFPADFAFPVSADKPKPAAIAPEPKPEPPAPKNALVDLAKAKADDASKKARKGKLTSDEPSASDEHLGVDPGATAGPEDKA
jgi:hypothetical protein